MTEQEKIERRKLLIDRINRKMFTDEDKGCVKASEIASFVESEIDRIVEPLVKAMNRPYSSFDRLFVAIDETLNRAKGQ